MRSADFWSQGRKRVLGVDTSWISNLQAAFYWYDRTIKEFHGTEAARQAYHGKLQTIIGWKKVGKHGRKYGIEENPGLYIPIFVDTFRAFEQDFPSASTLQAFRFQIAETYWRRKDWKNTRIWLKEIIKRAGDVNTFYRDLALRRLEQVK